VFSGCSLQRWALTKVAHVLAADGGTVFSGDDDPALVGDALPFALKTYESLLASLPDDDKLLYATGKAFCMYAYAYVQYGADTLDDAHFIEKKETYKRAKKLYLRGRGYLLHSLESRHPGFKEWLAKGQVDSALCLTTLQDTSLLYWTGMAWMGAFSVDKFDMSLALSTPTAVALLKHAAKFSEAFAAGSLHDFFISWYGSLPASMGGSESVAREHFARSIELSHGTRVGTYITLATTVCVAKQDTTEFISLLQKACDVDINADPGNRLANTLSQRRAQWLLKNKGRFFLFDDATEEGISQ
jgi:predicted anti-sigma-YlaC factor YlaD